jgi:signal transduction histidine kinase
MENTVDGITPYTDATGKQVLKYAEKMSELVTYLLDLTKIGAGEMQMDVQEVKIWDWIFECVEPLQMTMPEKDLGFVLNVVPEDLVVKFDPKRLGMAMTNIISNAIRHAQPGTEVQIDADREDGKFEITIYNQGESLPEDLDIFNRFTTNSVKQNAGATKFGGTGIGLSIAKWVVDLHGGQLSADDPLTCGYEQPGALFRIVLP